MDTPSTHQREVALGERFAFGKNWAQFLFLLDDERILAAKVSLCRMLEAEDLTGKTFLDVGSGSGLFSLAARSLGATVFSFDYDPQSVACTRELKRRYYPNDSTWTIQKGSVLDLGYLASLGQWDIVYSWGVLHHTGAMWQALDNVATLVSNGGNLFIALYNDQGILSKYWSFVKKTYCSTAVARPLIIGIHSFYPTLPSLILRTVTGTKRSRGMSAWHDLLDWLGGFPFETSKPEDVFEALRRKGFLLLRLKTCGGRLGCNEYVFQKQSLRRYANEP